VSTTIARTSLSLFARYPEVLACPACRGDLRLTDRITCVDCGKTFDVDGGIPLLFHPHDPLAKPTDLTCDLAEDGWRRCEGCSSTDASFQSEHDVDVYQQFVPESQQRAVEKLSSLSQRVN